MSGTLPKSPSEGDLTSKSAEFPQTLTRKKSLGRTSSFLPLGANKFYLSSPDLKKGAFANSNFRIVWKSATYGDLSNLNKVLDLPPAPNTTPSPIPPKIGPTDHVFSEYFDPLAVHKRENVDSSEEEESDTKSLPGTSHRTVERKRLDTEVEDMPSVKLLKSLFEKSKQEEEIKVAPHYTRTSKKSKSVLEKNIVTVTDEPKELDNYAVGTTNTTVRETKENVKKLSLIIINENEKSLLKENSKDKGHSAENTKHEIKNAEATEKEVKTSSKVANIEADNIRKVKDLLSIFKGMEKKKEASSNASEIVTEKANPEVKSKIIETDVKPVESDKVIVISKEKVKVSAVTPDNKEVKAKESTPDSKEVKVKENYITTTKAKLNNQDLENKYFSEGNTNTSKILVSDLKRKWESMVIQKKKANKDIESTSKELKPNKNEDITKIDKDITKTDKDITKTDKDKISITQTGKMSAENLSQPKIVIEKKSSIEKEKEIIEKSKEDKTEDKIKSVTIKEEIGEKTKVTIKANIIEKEKELTNRKELKKSYSDSAYNTERDDKFRTSVKDLASVFEIKRVWETRSAPVTPVATSTPKVTFDYDIPLSEFRKTYEVFTSPSLEEINKKLKPVVKKEHESDTKDTAQEVISISSATSKKEHESNIKDTSKEVISIYSATSKKEKKEQESNIKDTSKEVISISSATSKKEKKEHESNIKDTSKNVISISSATSKLSTNDDKKSTSSLQDLKKRFSSESYISSNQTKTQYNYKDRHTSKTIVVGISDVGPLEKIKRIKSESQFSNKFIAKDVQVTTDVKSTDTPKDSVSASIITNTKTASKSAEKEVKQTIVESQPSVVQKTEKKIIEQKASELSSVQNTEMKNRTTSEQKTSVSKEMSLGSLERKGSVTQMKTMFERQSSASEILVQKKEAPLKKMQHSHSVGSLNTQIKSSSKETNIKTLSTIVQESKEIREHDDVKIEFSNKDVIKSSEDSDHKFETSNKKDKKKTKIEELVESFVKSEGLSEYLEAPQGENRSTTNYKESKDSDVSKSKDSDVSKSKDSNVSKLKNADVSKSKDSDVSKSKVSDVSKSKDSDVSKSKDSDVSKSKDSNVSKSKDSNVSKSKDSDVSKFLKVTDTFKNQEKERTLETPASEEVKKISEKTTSSLSSSAKDKKPEEVNNTTLVARSGSRELRPDELKYFQHMTSFNKDTQVQKRERSNSIDSSSPTSTLPKNNFNRSKMRSSSRQFRDLHSDELKYFDSKMNDKHSKKLLSSQTEMTLRQEVLERALLASSLEENEREE